MPTPYFYPSTTDPPALSADGDAAVQQEMNIPWMLLELLPYIAKCPSALVRERHRLLRLMGRERDPGDLVPSTSAVRLLPVRPEPSRRHPSGARDHRHGRRPHVSFGSLEEILSDIDNLHYYVYQADDVSGRPSLKHLPRILPRCRSNFDATDVGVLRYQLAATKEYIVAGIVADVRGSRFVGTAN